MLDDFIDQYVLNGGALLAPLALCAFLAIGFALQGMILLRRGRVLSKRVFQAAREAATPPARRAFVEAQREASSPLGRAAWIAFRNAFAREGGRSAAETDEAIEIAAERIADDLEGAVAPLQTIYAVAPLLGFLGTLMGMIEALNLYRKGGEAASTVAAVLGDTLLPAFWSLPVAIVAYLAARWLARRVRRYELREIPAALREIDRILQGSLSERGEAAEAQRGEPSAPPRPMSTTTLFAPGTPEAAVLGRTRPRGES